MGSRHEPVLVREVLDALCTGPGLYLDATLGDGGHAEALLEAEPQARVLGCDRDAEALAGTRERLARFGDRLMCRHATFRELPSEHARAGGEPLAGALLDLGLSSRQIDDPTRGISFQSEGPLDMRMDRSRGATLAERLAEADVDALTQVLRDHGDLGPARPLARALIAAAGRGELPTTRALAARVDRVLGGRPSPRRTARVFQALRMWVNDEGDELDAVLAWLPDAVRPGGVVVTLAYHSGEDRRIKRALRGPAVPAVTRRLPIAPDAPAAPWESLHRKVVTPSTGEIASNPRARSARLRAFRRKTS